MHNIRTEIFYDGHVAAEFYGSRNFQQAGMINMALLATRRPVVYHISRKDDETTPAVHELASGWAYFDKTNRVYRAYHPVDQKKEIFNFSPIGMLSFGEARRFHQLQIVKTYDSQVAGAALPSNCGS